MSSSVVASHFAGNPTWRGWALISVVVGVVVIGSLVVSNAPGAPVVIIQRIGLIIGWVWVAGFAARLLRAAPGAGTARTHEPPIDVIQF